MGEGVSRGMMPIHIYIFIFFFFFFLGGGGGVQILQWKLSITRSLGPRIFVCYIRYFMGDMLYNNTCPWA